MIAVLSPDAIGLCIFAVGAIWLATAIYAYEFGHGNGWDACARGDPRWPIAHGKSAESPDDFPE